MSGIKIAIIGPGILSIPPVNGWGAVEILIFDYFNVLIKKGYDVRIINTSDGNDILNQINIFNPDIVHIQYDDWVILCDYINIPTIITSHYAYLEQIDKHYGYKRIFDKFISSNVKIFALSDNIKNTYISHGKKQEDVFVVPNGVRYDLFKYNEKPEDKSIYLAKIDYRKRQYIYHNIPDLYFVGNISDDRYNLNNYLGEWSKPQLYDGLTNFSNLVLLSDGEAHPLVCIEAMSAGLGLVISEYASANLNTDLDFIDVIPNSKLDDIDYISDVIKINRSKSSKIRNDIRKYVYDNFDLETSISNIYIRNIMSILKK
jgi:hypothetical protein